MRTLFVALALLPLAASDIRYHTIGGPKHHHRSHHQSHHARRAPLPDLERDTSARASPPLPNLERQTSATATAWPPLGPASNFYANLLQSMPLATATSPYYQAKPLAISNDVLGNAASWNAYSHGLANGFLAPFEQWTALRAAQLVPNGGMLLHQGALPIGMRRELVAFGQAKQLAKEHPFLTPFGGERWIPKAPPPKGVSGPFGPFGDGFTGLPDTDA